MILRTIIFFVFFLTLSFIVSINEISRVNNSDSRYVIFAQKTINPNAKEKNKCTWACYHNTNWCKTHHVKYLKSYFSLIDPVYFGIISTLMRSGNYLMANLFVFVVLFPALLLFLVYKVIQSQLEILNLRKKYGSVS